MVAFTHDASRIFFRSVCTSFIMIILFGCLWPVQKSAHNLAKPVEQQHQRMRTDRLVGYACVSQGAKSLSSLTYLSVQSVHRVQEVCPFDCLAFYLFGISPFVLLNAFEFSQKC